MLIPKVMKKHLLILSAAVFIFTSYDASGQRWRLRRYEADLYASAVSFHGDIGLADRPLANNFNGMRPTLGIKPAYRLNRDLSVCLDLAFIMYGGSDKEGSTHGRLYSFTTMGFQHVARMEYYIIGEGRRFFSGAIYNRRGMINSYNQLYLYAFAGAGGVLSKAKVKDLNNGGEEPLSNPGYDNNMHYTPVFPLGGGIKFSVDPRWSLGLEIGYQFSLSDYLDGYASTWSQYNDSYYLTSVKAIYHIRNDRSGRPVFRRLYR